MASVTLSEVRKAYSGFEVIHGIDLDVRSGEFLVLVGPSGCGKSTLLRMIAGLYQRLGTTMIYVTHDQIEAMTMATRIVVLNKGNVEQVGTPFELYNFPRNLFVASFIGSPRLNLLSATVIDGKADIPGLGSITLPPGVVATGPITIGLRPEQLPIDSSGPLTVTGTITLVEYLGSEVFIYLRLETGQTILVKAPGKSSHQNGENLTISLHPDDAHYFDADGQRLGGTGG